MHEIGLAIVTCATEKPIARGERDRIRRMRRIIPDGPSFRHDKPMVDMGDAARLTR